MTSIEEFFFRYYTNRLLREGYISQQEYQLLMSRNNLGDGMKETIAKVPSAKSTDFGAMASYNGHRVEVLNHPQPAISTRYPN